MDVFTCEKINHSGATYDIGERITGLTEYEAKRLVEMQVAVLCDGELENEPVLEEPENDDNIETELNEYTISVLKELCAENNINFKEKITKKELIQTIMKSGKAELFFDDGEEDE